MKPLGLIQQENFVPAADFRGQPDTPLGFIQLGRRIRNLHLPEGYGILVREGMKLHEDEAQAVRSSFTRPEKREFRERFAEMLGVTTASLAHWQIHHIRPVCIGGNNRFRNLDLIPPKQHSNLHGKVIDPQTFAAPVGVAQDFIIPMRIGRHRVRGDGNRPARIRPESIAALNADF